MSAGRSVIPAIIPQSDCFHRVAIEQYEIFLLVEFEYIAYIEGTATEFDMNQRLN